MSYLYNECCPLATGLHACTRDHGRTCQAIKSSTGHPRAGDKDVTYQTNTKIIMLLATAVGWPYQPSDQLPFDLSNQFS